MAIRVSGKNLDVGEALRSQAETRLQAALGKYFDGAGAAHVMVSRDGAGFRTDCIVKLGHGATLEASGTAQDAHASFDLSALRIEKRLRRYKRRIRDRSGEGGSHPPSTEAESAYVIIEAPGREEIEADDEDYHPVVIAETTRRLDRLTVGDAVIELDLAGAPALVFRHAGHGRVNVVYRRQDGSIGWVDPPLDDADDPGRRLAKQ
ncbi:ribosome hibernation-promoting factor, HPF/YfiA family [Enterovirga sp. CN4-39]|uniref:ribosome hibernation-promoting factor, HPF/YfiA family n=1 Tax=Enterovirga sp. CN4-39 TaxID=3400910 RepID=UPI003C129E86